MTITLTRDVKEIQAWLDERESAEDCNPVLYEAVLSDGSVRRLTHYVRRLPWNLPPWMTAQERLELLRAKVIQRYVVIGPNGLLP